MDRQKLYDARGEALRFVKRVNELIEFVTANADSLDPQDGEGAGPMALLFGNKETSSVRRSSMDLTRALAVLRK